MFRRPFPDAAQGRQNQTAGEQGQDDDDEEGDALSHDFDPNTGKSDRGNRRHAMIHPFVLTLVQNLRFRLQIDSTLERGRPIFHALRLDSFEDHERPTGEIRLELEVGRPLASIRLLRSETDLQHIAIKAINAVTSNLNSYPLVRQPLFEQLDGLGRSGWVEGEPKLG